MLAAKNTVTIWVFHFLVNISIEKFSSFWAGKKNAKNNKLWIERSKLSKFEKKAAEDEFCFVWFCVNKKTKREWLPARKLKDADPLGLWWIRATKHSKYATHCVMIKLLWYDMWSMRKRENLEREKGRKEREINEKRRR